MTTLNLGYNDIGVEGLASILSRCRHDIGSNEQKNNLISLDVQFNDIGPDSADHIADALRAPKPSISSDGVCHSKYGLISLTLLHTELGSEAMIKIANALICNGGNKKLKHLDLGSNEIGNEGTIALAEALGQNSNNTEGAAAAGEEGDNVVSTCLSHLFLFDNDIGKDGGESLLKCLKFNKILTFIDLEENDELEDDGEILESINDALKLNRNLKINKFVEFLDTSSSSSSSTDIKASSLSSSAAAASEAEVVPCVKKNELSFDFEGDGLGDECLIQIASILSSKFSETRDEGKVDQSNNLNSLTSLNLNDNGITEEGLSALADALEKGNHNIKEIKLKYNPIFKQGAGSSTALSRIETVIQANMTKE